MYAFSQKKNDKDKEKAENVKLYQGTTIGVEVAGLGNYVLGSDILSSSLPMGILRIFADCNLCGYHIRTLFGVEVVVESCDYDLLSD